VSDADLLRHTVATLAYRGGKAMRDAPPGFAQFRADESARTPLQIVAHMGDLFDWACCLARGEKTWNEAKPQSWEHEVERFFDALRRFDQHLASQPLQCKPERLFQGPIADALTHVGQLAMLRRMAGAPMRGENYYIADIAAGRVGSDQPPPKREFS
jgi:hypothetical protein